MAYYYDFDGSSYFDAGNPHNALGFSNYRLIIKAAFNGTASGFYVIQGNNGNDRVRIRLDNFDFLEVRYTTSSSRVRWQLDPSEYADNQPHEFEIVRNGDSHELFLDGVSQGVSTSSTTASDTANFIGRANATTTEPYALYEYKAYDSSAGGNLIFDYGDKNASGTEMLNTAGTNAILQGNQNWVFYNDGGGSTLTAGAAFSVNAPIISSSATVTLPQPNADVSYTLSAPTVSASVTASLPQPAANISYSLPSPSVSANAAASLPQPASDIAFTVNTPSVSASASSTMPGYNASVSFTVNAPTVVSSATATLPSPVVNVGYAVSTPSINANANASLPQPDSGIAFTVNAPSVSATASATQTGYNADVNFTISAPSTSISASATLPQPNTAVSFAVSPPQVSVVAIVGGIAIIVDDETNINQRVLSNNINAPILSNNING